MHESCEQYQYRSDLDLHSLASWSYNFRHCCRHICNVANKALYSIFFPELTGWVSERCNMIRLGSCCYHIGLKSTIIIEILCTVHLEHHHYRQRLLFDLFDISGYTRPYCILPNRGHPRYSGNELDCWSTG